MLETLRINNYALIDEVEIEFRPGFNILTGETGAGKSILVGALNLVLGARATGEVVRTGAPRATIDAAFRISRRPRALMELLKAHDVDLEDGVLLLSRTISAEGRSRAYAGGKLVPITVLAAIGDELVDLHGQHEHQSLLKAERQLALLDAYAETESLADEVAAMVADLRALGDEIAALESNDRERTRQIEFLRFEVREIGAAALRPGEEEELKARLNLISNAETVYTLANQAYAALYEGDTGAAIDRIDAAARDLDALAAIDARFQALSAQLAEGRACIEAIAGELRGYAEQIEFDPQELDDLNRRQALLSDLKRKYGATVDCILAYRDKASAEVAAFEQRDERLEQMRKQYQEQLAAARTLAGDLSRQRHAAAQRLDKRVRAALQDLGMKGAEFQTAFETSGLGSHGVDRVEFLLAANAGEKLKPLRQVASGGEVSRIMLALKAVFAAADHIPALIFDEIDAGVGGTVARKVGAKLAELADSHQVICITHIPQIAVRASAHFLVSKDINKGRSLTRVARVENEARIEELARLLDGSVSEVSLEHARTLLASPET